MLSKRGKTAVQLIDSFIKYLTAIIVVVVLVLLVFGVDPLALFASIGILGLVIGLSAQSLISDIISGLFIVFEGEYEVGDYIVIEGFRGKVVSIGLRTTQMVDVGGNNKIINNSEIRTLINLSYADSLFYIDVKIKHEDFERAESAIIDSLDKWKEEFPQFTDGPKYIGVSDFTDFGPQLKIIGRCKEDVRFQSERDLRRAIKVLFDEHKIDIALPKVFIEDVKSNS